MSQVNRMIEFETRKYSFIEKLRLIAKLPTLVLRLQNLWYTEAGGVSTKRLQGLEIKKYTILGEFSSVQNDLCTSVNVRAYFDNVKMQLAVISNEID